MTDQPDQSFDDHSDAESASRASPLGAAPPMRFFATLGQIFRFFPQVAIPVSGYVLLWMLAHGAIAFGTVVVAGFLGTPGILIGFAASVAVFAYISAVAIKRMDDVYEGRDRGGHWGFAADKFKSVLKAIGIKILAMVPVFGLIYFLIRTYFSSGPAVTVEFAYREAQTFGGPPTVDLFFFEAPLPLLGAGLVFLLGMAAYLFIHFADVVVVVEDRSARQGIGRALDIVKGWRNWMYAAVLFASVCGLVVSVQCLSNMAIAFGDILSWQLDGPWAGAWTMTAGAAVFVLTNAFGVIANYVIFQSLRTRRENWSNLMFDVDSLPDEQEDGSVD